MAIWLDEVQARNRDLWAQTAAGIEKLRDRQNHRSPLSIPLGNGLFELRTRSRSDIGRVLYFFLRGRRIVLLHGFIKKTQRTPPSELELARQRMRDYLERYV